MNWIALYILKLISLTL